MSLLAHRCRLVSFLSCASLAMLARHFFQESKRSRVPRRATMLLPATAATWRGLGLGMGLGSGLGFRVRVRV